MHLGIAQRDLIRGSTLTAPARIRHRVIRVDDYASFDAAAEVPPLPGGEGWGEGEYGEHPPVLFPQVFPPNAPSTR